MTGRTTPRKRTPAKPKGFRVPARTARAVFTDPDFAGAEVQLKINATIGSLLDLQAMRDEGDVEALFGFLAEVVMSWNIEDDDGLIPVTADGMRRIDPFLMNGLLDAWEAAVTGQIEVPAPLAQRSSGGGTSTSRR